MSNTTFWRHRAIYYLRFWLQSRNQPDWNALSCFNDYNQKADVPELFRKVYAKMELPAGDEFDRALEIARIQRRLIKGGRSLGFASDETLQLMLDGQGGVCSDQAQAYNVFCLLDGIKVREWGTIESASTPNVGHVINEIYSTQRKKWIAIDVMKNLWFKGENGEPLSVLELFSSLRAGRSLKYEYFSEHRCIDMYKIERTYSKEVLPFLIDRYVNKTYDSYLKRFKNWKTALVHGMMIALGKNYRYLFVLDNYKSEFFGRGKKSAA